MSLYGNLPNIGEKAKDFSLIGKDLKEVTLSDFMVERIVMNIFPSVDSGICAISVKTFNEKAASLTNTKVLCIYKRFTFCSKQILWGKKH